MMIKRSLYLVFVFQIYVSEQSFAKYKVFGSPSCFLMSSKLYSGLFYFNFWQKNLRSFLANHETEMLKGFRGSPWTLLEWLKMPPRKVVLTLRCSSLLNEEIISIFWLKNSSSLKYLELCLARYLNSLSARNFFAVIPQFFNLR